MWCWHKQGKSFKKLEIQTESGKIQLSNWGWSTSEYERTVICKWFTVNTHTKREDGLTQAGLLLDSEVCLWLSSWSSPMFPLVSTATFTLFSKSNNISVATSNRKEMEWQLIGVIITDQSKTQCSLHTRMKWQRGQLKMMMGQIIVPCLFLHLCGNIMLKHAKVFHVLLCL